MADRAAHGLTTPAFDHRSHGHGRPPGGLQKMPASVPVGDLPAAGEAVQGTPSLSSLHRRGGLGKTLLIAFLLLAIVPLSFLAYVTYHRVQRNVEQNILASLQTIVSLQGARLVDWVGANHRDLALVAAALDRMDAASAGGLAAGEPAAGGPVQAELEAQLQALRPVYEALVLADLPTGRVLASTDGRPRPWLTAAGEIEPQLLLVHGLQATPPADGGAASTAITAAAEPAIRYAWDGKLLLGVFRWDALREVIAGVEDVHFYVVTPGGSVSFASDGEPALLPASAVQGPPLAAGRDGNGLDATGEEASRLDESRAGAYQDGGGVPVFGAYRWVPELGLGLLAEQPQEQVLAGGDAVTALIVGATLAVALLTAAIAAVVTRRITQPIVQLTATASWMARGDLSRRVEVARRDEIGVLAAAFNRMAAELQILYGNLEARVAERTAQLAAANEQARYHARQLAISAEVARVASSIRDLPALLSTVVELIGRSFELDQVSIYLLQQQALPAAAGDLSGAEEGQPAPGPLPLAVWQAVSNGRLTFRGAPAFSVPDPVEAALAAEAGGPEADGAEMAIPLEVCGRTVGVLHVKGQDASAFAESDPVIYRSLADQIAIAIENASVYALEHETVRRLRELDRIQSRFLTNMSHALRTPLNSIIGFSRVMLKGLDGSLNDLQRGDLLAIHEGGRQILGLIDDLLELSQWDIAPFDPGQVLPAGEGQDRALALSDEPASSASEVNLAELVEGVMATACALARDKPIHLYHDLPADLPRITTDGRLLRRLILALLANAVKYLGEGQIRLAVTSAQDSVTVSVAAAGREEAPFAASMAAGGVPAEFVLAGPGSDRQRKGEALSQPWAGEAQLVLAQHIVDRLGGRLQTAWPGAQGGQEGDGTAFAFTLPIAGKQETGLHGPPGGQI